MSASIEHEERTAIKIIVAFENEFRAYQGTLAATIGILRPDAEVMTAEPEKLKAVAKRFEPDIVIGSQFKYEDLLGVPAWIQLSLDPAHSTKVSMDGHYSEISNPTLDKLLAIIEQVAQLTRTNDFADD
jgi:stage V sporulation protein SpoVS